MESVLNYIVSNYVWFLGGFIVLTMMIIGYIADVTDFWHKKKEEKPKDKKQDNKIENHEGPTEEELESLKNKTLGDAILPNQIEENINVPMENNNVILENIETEDLNAPFGDVTIVNQSNKNIIDEDLTMPFTNENLNIPLENNTEINAEENLNSIDKNEEVVFHQPVITSLEELNVPTVNDTVFDSPENINSSIIGPNLDDQQSNSDSELSNDANVSVSEVEEIPLMETKSLVNDNLIKPIEEIKEFDYVEPIVPEFITETVGQDEQPENKNEEDIWKF